MSQVLLIAALALVGGSGARCHPEPEQTEETVLTILAKPVGSSFEFPDDVQIEHEIQRVQDFFLEASYQKVLLRGADSPDLASDRVGPVEIGARVYCGAEDIYADEVIRALGDGSVDFTRYDHVVVVAPDPRCGTNGYNYEPRVFSFGGQFVLVDYVFINAGALYYGNNGTQGAGLVVHELGHQFSLRHSGGLLCGAGIISTTGCDEGEYLDLIDTMGASLFFGHFNAIQKEQLGWLDSSEVLEVTASGQYALGAYEVANNGHKALKLRRQDDSWLYVEYRTPVGFDDMGAPGFTDGAVFHLTRPGPPFSGSYVLLGPTGYAVQPGEVMEDVRGHRIEVLAKTPQGILLDVRYSPPAESVPPTLTAFRSAGSAPGLSKATISASDASGIARVEVYAKQRGPSNFDWTRVTLLGAVDAPGATTEIEVPTSGGSPVLEAVAYDGEGNVARREF